MLQKIKNRIKEQRGFTLVELLAVIVILGIIAAIAVPAIGNIIDNSRKDAEIADALMVINAAKLARAAGEDTEDDEVWLKAEIQDYLTNSSDFVSVTYDDDNGYTIIDHDGLMTEFEKKGTFSVTEAKLLEGRDTVAGVNVEDTP